MRQTVFAAIAAVALALQSPQFSISGVVRLDGEPVAGVTITVSGPQGSRSAVTGPNGEYQLGNLPRGPHRLSAALAGFRDQSHDVVLTRDMTRDFDLQPGILAEVLWLTPSLADAFRQADDIARFVIDRELPAEPCGKVVTAMHAATVLESIKGPFPTRIRFGLEGSGTCLDGTQRVRGMNHALEPGQEYVAFLHRVGDHFESVAGLALMFPVENGSIRTDGSQGLAPRMTVAEFYAAVKRLARED